MTTIGLVFDEKPTEKKSEKTEAPKVIKKDLEQKPAEVSKPKEIKK